MSAAHAPSPPEFDALHTPLECGATLIEASAGTGKTFTIAALFLRLVAEHGLAVGDILVTTYTVPATAELRARIRRRLREAHDAFVAGEAADPFLRGLLARHAADRHTPRARLADALRNFDEAAIHTIHSFCQRMLQERAFESGSASEPALLPDQSELVREVVRDYWRREFYECPECLALAAMAEGLGLEALTRLLETRLQHPLATILPPAVDGELEEARRALTHTFERLRTLWNAESENLARHFLRDHQWAKNTLGDPSKMQPILETVGGCLGSGHASAAGFEALRHFARSNIARFTRAKHTPPEHLFFDACEELLALTERFAMALRHDFLRWTGAELARRKAQRHVVHFGDLLTRLHSGLCGEGGDALAQAIRARFRAALIDEFQDTDAVQDAIFHRVFSGRSDGWLFLIGDPKQAIYGFRSADVFTYLQAKSRADRACTLPTNYRAVPALVAAVNHLFARLPRAFVFDRIPFGPVRHCEERAGEVLAAAGCAAPLRVSLWSGDESVPVDEARQQLLAAVADQVRGLIQDSGARLGGRRVEPGDIAILTATNDQAQRAQAALRACGVASVLLTTGSVFHSPDAAEFLAVLAAIAWPGDEARLRAALFTGALGLSATALHALRENESAWEERLLRFRRCHDVWLARGFPPAFRRLLREERVCARLLARPDGTRRLTNLLHLAELVGSACDTGRLSPRGAVGWLAARIASDEAPEAGHEQRPERDGDAVRIVTVHKSKGLEYPIVFLPFAWDRAEVGDARNLRFHDPAANHALTLDLGSPRQEENLRLAETEALAEDVRLLYVALTRARSRCEIVWGRFKGSGRSAAAWLLHAPPELEGEVCHGLGAHMKELSPAAWRADLEALAASSGGAIEVADLQFAQNGDVFSAHAQAATRARSEEAEEFAETSAAQPLEMPRARRFEGRVERRWRIASFSSLTGRGEAERSERGREEAGPAETRPAEAVDEATGGIHAFPTGLRAGVCLHAVFEDLDFTKPSAIEPLVREKLTAFGFDQEQWVNAVAGCVRRTLAAPLPAGCALAQIGRSARLSELEFLLPAHRLDPQSLGSLLGAELAGRLEFEPCRGWVRGFIDLVFEHGGRFYLADWKSNRLGDTAAAYTPRALATTMAQHCYTLQMFLYSVALHRYLGARLRGHYDPEWHLGGAAYLFLRGIDPDQPEFGVHFQRPETDAILALDRLLEGPK